MTQQYDNSNQFALFVNERGKGKLDPTHTGSGNLANYDITVAAWRQQDTSLKLTLRCKGERENAGEGTLSATGKIDIYEEPCFEGTISFMDVSYTLFGTIHKTKKDGTRFMIVKCKREGESPEDPRNSDGIPVPF